MVLKYHLTGVNIHTSQELKSSFHHTLRWERIKNKVQNGQNWVYFCSFYLELIRKYNQTGGKQCSGFSIFILKLKVFTIKKKKLKWEIVVIWFYKRIVPTVLGEPKLIKVPKIYFCLKVKEITCIGNFMCLEGNASPNEAIPTLRGIWHAKSLLSP